MINEFAIAKLTSKVQRLGHHPFAEGRHQSQRNRDRSVRKVRITTKMTTCTHESTLEEDTFIKKLPSSIVLSEANQMKKENTGKLLEKKSTAVAS